MYKEICDFAKLHNCVIQENRKTSTIAGYVLLDADGTYCDIEYIDKKDRKSKIVPDFGSFSRTEKQSNPICEKADYIFNKSAKKHESWVSTMLTGQNAGGSLSALCRFISDYESNDILAEQVCSKLDSLSFKADEVISFKIDGNCIEDMESDWNNWLLERMDAFRRKANKPSTDMIISSISGELQKSVPAEAGPVISNVPNDIKAAFGLSRAVYVAAAKYPSYESYGFNKALGFQLGEDDAKAFAAGMEYLLKENNGQHRNKDFQVVYFYDREVDDIISQAFAGVLSEDEELDLESDIETNRPVLSEILSAVRTGQQYPGVPNEDAGYYMVQFSVPMAGRHYLSNEIRGKYGDLAKNLFKWYADTQLVRYDDKSKRMIKSSITKFYSILMSCISSPNLTGDKAHTAAEDEFGSNKMSLLGAIYKNTQIPPIFFHRALERAVTSMSSEGKISRMTWIQIIKCYLIRKGYDIMSDQTHVINSAYACGQLFATYECMQYHYAGGKLNKNLAQCYFAAALKQPSVIFPQLADLSVVYLNNIKYAGIYVQKLGELSNSIGTSFPKSFTDDEKGSFVLGYYQQKAEFMNSAKTAKMDDTTQIEDEGE